MVNDDVYFGFRLRLFSLAAELGNVREGCRLFGIHTSTCYRCRRPVLRSRARDAPAARAATTPHAQPDEPARRAPRSVTAEPPRSPAKPAS